jgi:nicotinamidase/pyrazinamidase
MQLAETGTRYDDSTALIVVDVQNDFADPDGSLYVRGGEDVVDLINAEIAAAGRGGASVVYTQDWHPARTPHFAVDGGHWPVHCVQNSWGAELHPRLVIQGPVLRKGSNGEDGYSGFTVREPETGLETSTGLAELLEADGRTRVVVTGLAGDVCVKHTALDAVRRGFEVTVLDAATRDVEHVPGDGARARQEMIDAGVRIVS